MSLSKFIFHHKPYTCEFEGCRRKFKKEGYREQHYRHAHRADIYTENIQEPCDFESVPDPGRFLTKAKRVELFFNKRYPRDDERGDSSMRSFIDLFTTGEGRIDPHSSEFGWNLPQDHPRHIFNFPAEILFRILKFVLVAPQNITPICVPRLKDGHTSEPTYQSENYWHGEQHVLSRLKVIPNCKLGSSGLLHTRYEAEYRRPIDATVLRVCKSLYEFGQPVLYGSNTFLFDLEGNAYQRKYQTEIIRDRQGHIVRKCSAMPASDRLNTDRIRDAIRNFYNVSSPLGLPNWMCCDAFIHFLYVIGPTNASYIRKLKIVGGLFPSSEDYRGYTTWDYTRSLSTLNLSYYVKAYAPFISLYCPNLDKLTISIKRFITTYGQHTGELLGLTPSQLEKSFEPQYNEVQPFDHTLDVETRERQLKFREEMRLRAHAEHTAKTDKLISSAFKILIDEVTSKMENLRTLKVLRPPPLDWNSSIGPLAMKHNKFKEFDTTPVEVDWANDTKLAIAEALRKRMQDLADTEEVKRLCLQKSREEDEIYS